MKHEKQNTVIVSHNDFHESIKKKRSGSIIHVLVRQPRLIQTKNDHYHPISTSKRKTSTNNNLSYGYTKQTISQNSHSTKETYASRSSKVSSYQNRSKLSDKNGMPNDYHKILKRNKKIKLSRRCFTGSLIISLIVVLIIAAILLAIFIKPKRIPSSIKVSVLRWHTSGITIAGNGTNGSANNILKNPRDIILDNANNLYVADSLNHRIQKFLFGSLNSMTIIGNGTAGSTPYQLNQPSRIIFDSDGNIYISDTFSHRIQFWRNNALLTNTIAGTSFGGNASYQLNIPYGIALNQMNDILYISDYNNHRIISYAIGASNGTLVFGGTGSGKSNAQLYSPVGLQFDPPSKSLIITNYAAHNIVRYVLGANSWTLLAGDVNGTSGSTPTFLWYPTETIFDPMGNMYVADRSNHRIQLFYSGQFNGSTIAGITSFGSMNASTLYFPWSVRLDSQLNLYVADYGNHRIQKFLRY